MACAVSFHDQWSAQSHGGQLIPSMCCHAVGGGVAYFRKGSLKSLGSSLGAAVILALCGRNMVGATALSSIRVAFGTCILSTAVTVLMSSCYRVQTINHIA